MIIGTHIHSNKFGTNRTQNHQSLLKYIVKRSMRARVRYQRHISLNVIIIIANI